MHVHGLSDNTYPGKKPSTARVWRRCGGYCKCAAPIYDRFIGWYYYVRFHLEQSWQYQTHIIRHHISAIGFFSLLLFHSTEFMVSVTLAIISAGLSLSITGGFNIVLLSAPIQAT